MGACFRARVFARACCEEAMFMFCSSIISSGSASNVFGIKSNEPKLNF